MKIALRVTIELDADEWAAEYGIAPQDVRADVRRYITSALHDMPVMPTTVAVTP